VVVAFEICFAGPKVETVYSPEESYAAGGCMAIFEVSIWPMAIPELLVKFMAIFEVSPLNNILRGVNLTFPEPR